MPRLLLALMGVFAFCLFSLSLAEVPQLISYQGRLTDDAGDPVNATVVLAFRIYETASGGEAKWTESQSDIVVINGLFNVNLGSVTPFGNVFDGSTRYLSIQMSGEPEMEPRIPMISVPYAISARRADTADYALDGPAVINGWDDNGSAVILDNDDDSVGIGISIPSAKLDVYSSGTSVRGATNGGFGSAGVLGMADAGTGVYGFSAGGAGVQAFSATGYGGFFEGPISYFSQDVGIGTMTPDNPLEVRGIGTEGGGNSGYGEVIARFGNATTSQHSAVAVDAATGKDAIYYWSKEGAAFWSARNDFSRGNNFELRYHGGNAIGRVAMTVDSLGLVGIGQLPVDDRLEVDGNLEVNGAFKGDISSSTGSDGAPFPRPAYNSGYFDIEPGESLVLEHNIGGDKDNYFVDMWFYRNFDVLKTNIFGLGGYEGYGHGAFWCNLTDSTITVRRGTDDIYDYQIRVRIWVIE